MSNNSYLLRAVKDARFTLLMGWLLGALTNIYPLYAVISFAVLASGVFIFVYIDNRKELKQIGISDVEAKNLAGAENGAVSAASKTNLNLLVSGKAIEIACHPNVNAAVRPDKVGWDPKDIEIEQTDLEFDSKVLIERAGGLIDAEPPNNRKFCLVNTPFITSESNHLKLTLKETDYFTIETVKAWLKDNHELADIYGHASPEISRIPSSLCLHFTVRLSDGEILLMKRSNGMSYHENKWSASGEEQISDSDLSAEYPIDNLFKRALGEEILHLGDIENFPENIRAIENHIKYMRMYSIGTEWPLYNPALFGMIQLKDDRNSLRESLIARKFGSEYSGHEDREGIFYTISNDQAYELLSSGKTIAKSLFNNTEEVIESQSLHPTTRYRLFRLLRTLKRNKLIKHNKKIQRTA
ncbi:MAG: hypothetical protein V7771_01070 [Shewanella psychromarinicola]|uniref:hypothetical protein n=1 Tax=Shewanella psychromarinicola TaxID=2487742 RepID=UPI0030032743